MFRECKSPRLNVHLFRLKSTAISFLTFIIKNVIHFSISWCTGNNIRWRAKLMNTISVHWITVVWPVLTGSLGPQCIWQILAAPQLVECHDADSVICRHGKSCDCEAGDVATNHIHVPVTFPKCGCRPVPYPVWWLHATCNKKHKNFGHILWGKEVQFFLHLNTRPKRRRGSKAGLTFVLEWWTDCGSRFQGLTLRLYPITV